MRSMSKCVLLVVCALVLTGCVGVQEPRPAPDPPTLTSSTALPGDFLTIIADTDPSGNAIATSRALYSRAQLVITAPESDTAAQVLAASAAVAFGAPLLLASAAGGNAAALEEEISRLGASWVVNVGGDTGAGEGSTESPRDEAVNSPERLNVAATPDALNALLPVELEASEVLSEGDVLVAVANLDRHSPVLLALAPFSASERTTSAPAVRLPRVERALPLAGGMVLSTDEPGHVAAVATARAAGVDVLLVPADRPNPQASAELVATLGEAEPSSVIALGEPFAREQGLDWKIRAALTGVELPGGGQLLFPAHFFVALYGTPGAPVLGVLGEQGLSESITRAEHTAAAYDELTDRAVVPTMEIIATVAAGDAGGDGNYSNEIDAEDLRPWAEAAGAAGMYVVLDLQPGRSDFLTQAKLYEPLLKLPCVGLALDPEWRLEPDQKHLTQIGSVDVSEVNAVITWLADLTAEHALPQKMLVLHQFQLRMIQNRGDLDTSRDELALLIHVDGLGGQPDKQATWNALHADAPAGVAWGWKNFYDEDHPTLTPEQTMTGVAPVPDLVTYQ